MLRYTIRRILWAIPTIFGISIVAFLVTTLIPEPPPAPLAAQLAMLERDPASLDAYVESRRERLLDLPRFVNTMPRDVRTLPTESVAHLVANDLAAPIAAHQLARIGGAAFPFLLPALDRLEPAARSRVAMALPPIADRMGQGEDARVRDPQLAAAFWAAFWEDRSLEFTARRSPAPSRASCTRERPSRARSSRRRHVRPAGAHGSHADDDRAGGLVRLSDVASSVSGRDSRVPDDAGSAASGDVARLIGWWSVHRNEYVALDGGERVAASCRRPATDGGCSARAAESSATARATASPSGESSPSAPVTIALTLVSVLLSFVIAIPLGVIEPRAAATGSTHLALGLFLFYSLPNFFLAEILLHTAPEASGLGRVVLAVLTMTAGSVATLSRFQRASMLDVLNSDYVRTARAKGLPRWRVLVVHALRNAIVPTVTLAGLQLPLLFGAAIVVEEVFALPGVGFETMRAVEAHDASWLVMTVLVVCARDDVRPPRERRGLRVARSASPRAPAPPRGRLVSAERPGSFARAILFLAGRRGTTACTVLLGAFVLSRSSPRSWRASSPSPASSTDTCTCWPT